MAGDFNNTLEIYQQVVAAAATAPKAQLHLNEEGRVEVKTTQDKLQDFTSQEAAVEHNQGVLLDFKTVLSSAYGAQAAEVAFEATGMNAALDAGQPLFANQVPATVAGAQAVAMHDKRNAIEHANQQHLQGIADREARAQQWQPQPVASGLQRTEQPGLRLASHDAGDIRAHAWHLTNTAGTGTFELDRAVHAEMAVMANPPADPHLHQLQARLNLLEKMVGEAHQNLLGPPDQTPQDSAKRNVFTAPEWLFAGMRGQHEGQAVSGGALTESEMRKVTLAVTEMSARHPGLMIMPGTLLWSKAAAPMPMENGLPRPADVVLNCTPIVANGRLEHITYKQKEGMDPRMASAGINEPGPNRAYRAPSADNDFSARLQIFKNDTNRPRMEVDLTRPLEQIESIGGAGRLIPEWEAALRQGVAAPADWQAGFANTADVQENNHVFEFAGRTYGLDICADHIPPGGVKNEATSPHTNALRTRIQAEGGVDAQLLIASGSLLNTGTNYVKNGGMFAGTDLDSGVAQFQEVTHLVNRDTGVTMRPFLPGTLQSFRPTVIPPPPPPPPLPGANLDHDNIEDLDTSEEEKLDGAGDESEELDEEEMEASIQQEGKMADVRKDSGIQFTPSSNAPKAAVKVTHHTPPS